ncbi:Uncharacterised protein [Pandoraea pnomenusa]|uniref:Uncharacterized protein n=1 Tax=Pandoraea pnomenusa TaxID=93220 RepID=A0A379KD66_9BURK|nr:hypothetical protein [Pandoraea pnomenusa]SUD65840.1 Uncharacterised protein [Pandoraea pnomenusa]
MPDNKTVTFDAVATLVDAFDAAAQDWGWAADQGVGAHPANSKKKYETARNALLAALETYISPSAQSVAQEAVVQSFGMTRSGLIKTYPMVEMGFGEVCVGDGYVDDIPALTFSPQEFQPIGTQTVYEPLKEIPVAEVLCAITFANVESLDVVMRTLADVRKKFDAAPVNGGERAKPAPLFMTGWQLLEALDLVAPDRATDPDQMDEEIALQMGDETCHSGAGVYAWEASEPEEGSSFLAGERAAIAANQARKGDA